MTGPLLCRTYGSGRAVEVGRIERGVRWFALIAMMTGMGPGCVKTPSLFWKVEFPSQFSSHGSQRR